MRFVASPRHADLLLVTGPVARHMAVGLRKLSIIRARQGIEDPPAVESRPPRVVRWRRESTPWARDMIALAFLLVEDGARRAARGDAFSVPSP